MNAKCGRGGEKSPEKAAKVFARQPFPIIGAALLSAGFLLLIGVPVSIVSASNNDPSWWVSRNVIVTNAASTNNDYAAITSGQMKWIATNAYAELCASLPGGAGTNTQATVGALESGNNYYGVNVGQLKNLAQPFYDRLIAIGYTNTYPGQQYP